MLGAMQLQTVCVFCGARQGHDPRYLEAARALGAELGARGRSMVYGGGKTGLMGVVADAARASGARVTGVIPDFLAKKEIAHDGLDELVIVPSMHERKRLMSERADAFVAMPGGFGTLEELCEMLTWSQLGLHQKPIGVLDTGAFFEGLLAFFDRAVSEGFAAPEHRGLVVVARDPGALLDALDAWAPPPLGDAALDMRARS